MSARRIAAPVEEHERPHPRLVWAPLKSHRLGLPSSQELFMACPCHHVLFHGTRGPGKTDAQLMTFRSQVGRGYGSYWRGVIFDRRYKNLDDIISKAKRWFLSFGDGCQFLKSLADLKFVWPTGEELLLRQFESEDDYWNYHGQEFPFIGWNELTKYPTSVPYEMMTSCNRTSFIPVKHSTLLEEPDHEKLHAVDYDLEKLGAETRADIETRLPPPIPLWIRSTTNPYGPGHTWVKRRFIDAAAPGEVVRTTSDVFNPQTQAQEKITKTQVHIFGSYRENVYLPPEYILELQNITDPNRRSAWLEGNWDGAFGGVWDDLWRSDVHILPRFSVPHSWSVFRAMDWGSAKPFSIGYWAWCDGTEATLPNGRRWAPVRGSLIQIAEWYGSAKDHQGNMRLGDNVGLRLGPTAVAEGIARQEAKLLEIKWIAKKVVPGPADNSIRDVVHDESDSVEKIMATSGITWRDSDKSPGSRKVGVQLMRNRLEGSLKGEGPGIYWMRNCQASLALIPGMPRDEDDPDDVDTEAEDHVWDMTRYAILGADNRLVKSLKVKLPT